MGAKDTAGKPKLRLIPLKSLAAVAKIREYGNLKYGDDEAWKDVDVRDFVDAALRHLYKYLYEGDLDDESGMNHLAHAACSVILALENHLYIKDTLRSKINDLRRENSLLTSSLKTEKDLIDLTRDHHTGDGGAGS